MSEDIKVGIKLTADGKSVVSESAAAKQAINGLGDTAKKTNSESASAAEQYTAKLKRQAETLGMTASQTRAYDAAQLDLNSAQRASVDASNSAIAAGELHHALMGRLRFAAMAAAAAIGTGLVLALKSSVVQAAQAEQSHLRLQAVLTATGHAAGLTKAELDAMAESMKERLGLDDDALRDSMAVLLTFKNVSRDSFNRALEGAADLAAVMQTDLKSAVLQLGKALENPEEGLTALKRSGVSFSDTQKAVIKDLVDTGRQAEALVLVLNVVESQVGGVAAAMNQGMTKATRDAGLAWDDLLKALGKTVAVKGTVEGFFGGLTATLSGLKNLVENGDWLDRLAFFVPGMPGNALTGLARSRGRGRVTPVTENDPQAASAREGLARQQAAQQAEIGALAQSKRAEETAKKREEAGKRAAQSALQAIDGAQRYAAALKLETEQIGLNAVQKRMLAAATEAAKAPTAALRLEIMASAQAWAAGTAADATASQNYLATLKLETEQISLNVVQKRLLAAATEAAKAPTEALRLEIMASAQAWANATTNGVDGLLRMETDFRATLQRMQLLQDGINIKRQSGLLTEAQARSQISDLLQQTATDLDVLLPKMQALADAAGGEAPVRIAGLRNEVARLRIETDQYSVRFQGAVRNSMQGLFQGLLLGQKDAFSSMVQNFKTALAQMMAEALATKLMSKLDLGGGIGALFGLSGTAKVPLKKAAGGLLSGPGTGTSDSIPLWGSHGEFIVNAKSTAHWLPTLQAINAGSMPRFAAGGLVGGGNFPAATKSAANAPAPTNVRLTIHPDALHLSLSDWLNGELARIAVGGK